LTFKPLFSRSLAADPTRLHFAAHSHHLWPDAALAGHAQAGEDAARLADRKWDKVMGEVWPEAQAHVAREIGTDDPDAIVFSSNTHDFLVRLFSVVPRTGRLKVLTTDGEFHSARRQLARWEEAGTVEVERVAAEPFETLGDRFIERARSGDHELILVSELLFGSGALFQPLSELTALGRPEGPWVVVDGYHSFMAIEAPFAEAAGDRAFFLGGAYKYAMSGEGAAFMHAPPGYGLRPYVTGWFAEFEDLSLPPGAVGYAPDARRFLGATFDPSALYRFNAVQRMLRENGLTTARISGHAATLQKRLLEQLDRTPLADAELLNPLTEGPHARFLAFRSPDAQRWYERLKAKNVITDVRGQVLRIGFGIYQDDGDVDALVSHLEGLR
jgi:selenocysteine lyase/cysteine desulfurase